MENYRIILKTPVGLERIALKSESAPKWQVLKIDNAIHRVLVVGEAQFATGEVVGWYPASQAG